MQFDDHAIMYICHERDDGERPLVQGERVWVDPADAHRGAGPRPSTSTTSSRARASSTARSCASPRPASRSRAGPLLANFVSIGTGYGIDADWRHGMYHGPEPVTQGLVLSVEEMQGLAQYGIVDHVAEFSYDGHVGLRAARARLLRARTGATASWTAPWGRPPTERGRPGWPGRACENEGCPTPPACSSNGSRPPSTRCARRRPRAAGVRPRRLPGERGPGPGQAARPSAARGGRTRSWRRPTSATSAPWSRSAGPGFINLTLSDDFVAGQVAALSADPRLGVPAGRAPRDRRHRLLGAERGQGDARRPPAQHAHRRRAGPRARVPRPRRAAREPHRRLGHAVRHAHRAPARRRRGGERRVLQRARPQRVLRRGAPAIRHATPASRSAAGAGSCSCRAATPRRCGCGGSSSPSRMRHAGEVYDLLGVLLTDEDTVGESFYNPLLPVVVDELDEKGLLVEDDGALCVFPEGFENRNGEPLPLIVRKSDGGYGYPATDLACVARPHRPDRGDPADLRRRAPSSPCTCGWSSPSPRWPATCPTRTAAVHVGLRPRARYRRQEAGQPQRRLGAPRRPARRGDRPGRRRHEGALERPVTRAPGRRGARPRHRRGQVRRPVDGAHAATTSSTGTACSPSRATPGPYLQYAHARIRSIFRRAGVAPPAAGAMPVLGASPRSAPSPCSCCASRRRSRPRRRPAAPRSSAPTSSTWPRRSPRFYEACRVLVDDEAVRDSRLALCDLTARVLEQGLSLLGHGGARADVTGAGPAPILCPARQVQGHVGGPPRDPQGVAAKWI